MICTELHKDIYNHGGDVPSYTRSPYITTVVMYPLTFGCLPLCFHLKLVLLEAAGRYELSCTNSCVYSSTLEMVYTPNLESRCVGMYVYCMSELRAQLGHVP